MRDACLGLCALCGQVSILCDSHILPEFLYRRTYLDGGKGVELRLGNRGVRTRQKGYTEPLLCVSCEGVIGKYDTYFANVWLNGKVRPNAVALEAPMLVAGLDVRRFRLFHHSILWRMGVSKRQEFGEVRLGPHAERLRRMILAEDPGEAREYGVLGAAIFDPHDSSWADGIVVLPTRGSKDGRTLYSTVFGGCQWIYQVSSRDRLPLQMRSLDEDGILRLGRMSMLDVKGLKALVDAFDEE
jgi:hypothetical protein